MSQVLVSGSFAGLSSFYSSRIPVFESLSKPGIGVVVPLSLTIVLSRFMLRVVKPREKRDENVSKAELRSPNWLKRPLVGIMRLFV